VKIQFSQPYSTVEDISSAGPVKQPASTQIIYASIRPDNFSVYQRRSNGVVKLVGAPNRFESHPVTTPDGKAIIYSSNEAGSHYLFMRNLTDGTESKLTDHTLFEDHPHFDKNGYFYFCSDLQEGRTQIYRTKWTGQTICMDKAEKITSGPGSHFSFSVSPSGQEIVFCSNQDNLKAYEGPAPSRTYHAGRLYKMQIGQPETTKALTNAETGNCWEGTPVYSQDGKSVFYYSTATGKPQLYRYDVETASSIKLTQNDAKALYPAIDTNGKVLFSYQKHQEKPWKIKTMKSDGSELKTLFKIQQHAWAPQASADGTVTFFGTSHFSAESIADDSSPHGNGNFIVDEGTVPGNVNTALKTIRGYFPAVNLTQKKITYIEAMSRVNRCNMDGSENEKLYSPVAVPCVFGLSGALDGSVVTAAGTPFAGTASHIMLISKEGTVKNLTEQHAEAHNTGPSISKDGQTIIFSRQLPGESKQLFSMDGDGQNLKRLTNTQRHEVFPSLSACGKWVVYSSSEDKKTYSLRLLNLEADTVENLTNGYVDIHACFSPDGSQLVFSSNRGGSKVETPLSFFFNPQAYGDIYIMDLNSRKITQITSSPYEDSTPSWI